MMLLTKIIREKLLRNGEARYEVDVDPWPVVKLFTPDAQATWLLSEIDLEDHMRAFGLCDLGMGFPELGYVDLGEITTLRGRLGLPVERDRYWRAEKSLVEYVDEARAAGRIRA